MALNKLTTEFAGQAGIFPRLARMETDATLGELTTPGFLNGISNTGIQLQSTDLLFASYEGGTETGVFVVKKDDGGVFTLQVYSPGDNSFMFQNTWFVAKGGSDMNDGTCIGEPKETINGALTAANPTVGGDPKLIIGLDVGVYEETLSITGDVRIWMPNATLDGTTNNAIILNDAGAGYTVLVDMLSIQSQARAIEVNGQFSTLALQGVTAIGGDVFNEGGLIIHDAVYGGGVVETDSLSITNANAIVTGPVDISGVGGGIVGSFEDGTETTMFGGVTFTETPRFAYDIKNESSGRTINDSDVNASVIYNNVTGDTYTLPATSGSPIPVGAEVRFYQAGNGQVSFAAGAGVTIVSGVGSLPRTIGLGAFASALKISDTSWLIVGSIEPQP